MRCKRYLRVASCVVWSCVYVAGLSAAFPARSQETSVVPEPLRAAVEQAIAKVKPALVRIEVVSTAYHGGREVKYESSGSGVIITKEGHIVTNHHVAGEATRLLCTLSTKEEIEADLIGRDPLTDIAVIKLVSDGTREFPVAVFGDSSQVTVGDDVLAMGSPMSLSQSVTLGIVSNAELVMPQWLERWGVVEEAGENVGALVRWIGHDAAIFGGNSGGPLVNLRGEVIGINEIRIGLGAAIPGNLVKSVSQILIADGKVKRAWLGLKVQPRLKHASAERGVLIGGVIKDAPAARAGIQAGDILIRLNGKEVDVRFAEQLPEFNQAEADLPIGQEVELVVLRDGVETTIKVTPMEREEVLPKQNEIKELGITGRDISYMIAKMLKRDSRDGVLVTSVRAGGPAGDAKPRINDGDVIVEVNGQPVKNMQELRAMTEAISKDQKEPVPSLVGYERKMEKFLTVVKVGVKEIEDPGLEVKKAWIPIETQVLTRDIALQLDDPSLKGFRITAVYQGSTAEKAGLQVGDYILAVDGEPLTADAPEDYEELSALIRQYKIGSTAELTVLRNNERRAVSVELVGAPRLSREMKKYRDDDFEFTVRDITFFDKAREKWAQDQAGVLVEEVQSGGWAALGMLAPQDLILEVDGFRVTDVESIKKKMDELSQVKPAAVVLRVLRGIHTVFLELEPKWEKPPSQGKE